MWAHVYAWRRVIGIIAACAALVAPASAQQWKPARTVELVVGSAPGGSPDVMARLIQNIFHKTGMVPGWLRED